MKRHIAKHLDKICKECINYGDLKLTLNQVRIGVMNYFSHKLKAGLFNSELAWFLSEENGGGIYDSDPISEIVSDYFENNDEFDEEFDDEEFEKLKEETAEMEKQIEVFERAFDSAAKKALSKKV